MRNMTVAVDKQKQVVIVTIDLKGQGEPSASGKTLVVATTGGNVSIPDSGGFKLGLNFYKDNPAYGAKVPQALTPEQLEQARLVLEAQARHGAPVKA